MKIATSFLAGLLLIGAVGARSGMAADNGILFEQQLAPGSEYCHMQFRAIQPNTLGTNDPTLKSSDTGDVIDFYGPCNENPTGEDQVRQQKLDRLFWQNRQ